MSGGRTDPRRQSTWPRPYRLVAWFFAAYPLVAILTTRPDPVDAALAAVATALFVGLILVGWRTAPTDARRRSWWAVAAVAGILAIAVAITFRGHETWLAFFYFASAGASPLQPRQRTITLITICGAVAGGATFWLTTDIGAAALQGASVAVVGLLIFSLNETRRTNRALTEARDELARLAVIDERARIARDLHDTLGHSLSLITLKSELAGRLLPDDPDRARAEIADVERAAREALASVRETVTGYRRPTIEDELTKARQALAAANIETEIDAPAANLPPAVDAVVAWTIREAVTNAVRHSGATKVRIGIRRVGNWAEADVVDNGRGPDAMAAAMSDGTGLAGLAERIHALGGRFDAGPAEPARPAALAGPDWAAGAGGRGFRLDVRLPLDPAAGEP
jgi:two-component system, NarL family, sensor histidine kinase DesK